MSRGVWVVSLDQSGDIAVSVSADCALKVWNLSRGEIETEFINDDAMTSCTCLLDGTKVVAGDRTGRMFFFDRLNTEMKFGT